VTLRWSAQMSICGSLAMGSRLSPEGYWATEGSHSRAMT
jgi:hypothetical protein